MLNTSTLWYAAIARPDSLTIIGCGMSRALQTLAIAVHHVARVLVERVVHGGGVVRAAAVVVDPQPAADVDVLQARAHELELRVHVRELVDRILDAADVLQLAARVAVHELQAVEHVVGLEHVEELEDLGDEQAELGLLARRVAPAARALAGELDAHAEARAHAVVPARACRIRPSSSKFSTTGMMVRPSLVASTTASM